MQVYSVFVEKNGFSVFQLMSQYPGESRKNPVTWSPPRLVAVAPW